MQKNDRFGRLIFLDDSHSTLNREGYKIKFGKFLCDCGVEKTIRISNVKSGNTKSCGCLEIESRRTHGKRSSVEYSTWDSMIQRCYNKKHPSYSNYGGRGIKVCDRWLESFENFYEDMGEKPSGFWIERINPSADYYPENCKWEFVSVQQYNKRISSKNTSGKTGVYWNKEKQKWEVEIGVDNKRIKLGRYKDFELAVFVREEAELKYYGYLRDIKNGKED